MIIVILTVVSIVTRLLVGRQEESGLDSWHEQGIVLFSNICISALGFTQPPIGKVSGLLSPGVMRPGREPDYCHQISRFRISGARLIIPKMPLWLSHARHCFVVVVVVVVVGICAVKLLVNIHPLN